MTARVIVTGSRLLTSGEHAAGIERGLVWVGRLFGRDTLLVHGAARGADALAADRWERWGLRTVAYPATWAELGVRAGLIRNQRMIDAGADAVLAWPHPTRRSAGTAHCVGRALAAGLFVIDGWTLEPILSPPTWDGTEPEPALLRPHAGVR